jgi:hypothetical protein
MKSLIKLQAEFAAIRAQNYAFDKLKASEYDERFNGIILDALKPYVSKEVKVPDWYSAWCNASITVRGQAVYMTMIKHPLSANIHPSHIKALIATMAFESKLLPLVINKGADGLNSNLIEKNLKGGAAFGLDQRIASRKYDLVQKIITTSSDVFSLGQISKVVDFILNDINTNNDLATYKAYIMKRPNDSKTNILNCVQLYEGLSSKYADQWFITERLAFYNEIF